MNALIVLFLGSLLLTDSSSVTVPSGAYVASKTDECIIVENSKISFYFKKGNDIHQGYWNRTVHFSVQPDGKIQTALDVNSNTESNKDRYDWYWQDKKVVRVDHETHQQVVFSGG